MGTEANEIDQRGEQRSNTKDLTVVGLGASAGGIAALQNFFDVLPADTDMAFVVVTHLHPERESILHEILQSHTQMPVQQVNGRVAIEANHVYVLSPNRQIIITDSHLEVSEFEEPRGQRVPVDHFFRSLAAVHGEAIAVILSGGGTDGAVGVKSIKEQGGLLLVQDPAEAEYDSMPRAAIATGLADIVLPAQGLAQKLIDYRRKTPSLPQDPSALTVQEIETLQRILKQVQARTGHDFSQYKRSTILRRIQRRMQLGGYVTLDAYLGYLRHISEEAHILFNDLLIGVTNFFRDRESWEMVVDQVVPKLFENKGANDTVRAWTIGCSTGEEAYSLAIVLMEHLATLQAPPPAIQVFASDLDENALKRAREGLYPEVIEADVSLERLNRFFIKEGNYYRVRRELRDIVLFSNHSILRDPPFSRLDFISCRNLLIYLQRPLQEYIFEVFHYALVPERYLFLGSSESADSMHELFRTIDRTHRIYQARPWQGEHPNVPSLPLMVSGTRHLVQISSKWPQGERHRLFAAGLHQQALEVYGPPSILVNAAHQVLHLSETAGRYLLQPKGPLTNDLLKLVRPELQYELRSALFRVFEKGQSTITPPIYVQFNGHPHQVVLAVRPYIPTDETQTEESLVLVFFIENEIDDVLVVEQMSTVKSVSNNQEVQADIIIEQLQTEVRRLRERLQSNIEEYETSNEELKAGNEELQSINEEYRSTTEELETSKEELQSINEELQTVNNELKNKLDEISRAHSDLENLMTATQIATLFLDRELRIKRYTPGVQTLFNIMAGDRGRPISHLTHRLQYANLPDDAHEVIKTLVPLEREVQTEEGNWLIVRLRPYRTIDDRIEGVVVTFVDVTGLKQVEQSLRESQERYRLLVESVKEYAMFTVNPEGYIDTWNRGGQYIFGYKENEIVGQLVSTIFTAEDRAAGKPEEELTGARENGQAIDERWHVRKDGSRFWGSGVVTSLWDGDNLRGYAKILRDNTERRQMEHTLRDLNESLEERVALRTKALQESEERIRELALQLSQSEQAERERIAQILHDDLQQQLYAIQVHLVFLLKTHKLPTTAAMEQDFAQFERLLSKATAMSRDLSYELSPPVLQGSELKDALQWLSDHMQAQHGLKVTLHTSISQKGDLLAPNQSTKDLIFQIVRELLFNIVKHAGIKEATVTLEQGPESIRVQVADEGDGFDAKQVLSQQPISFGLSTIRRRLELLGGTMQVVSAPQEGTEITIVVPLTP